MAFNPNFEQIGNEFIKHYYQHFDVSDKNARANSLGDLYDPENSFFTFEQSQCKGREAILQKITVFFIFYIHILYNFFRAYLFKL